MTEKKKRKSGRPKIPMVTKDLRELENSLPPKVIILDQVLHWMNIQSTAEEIAGSYFVSVDTLDRRLKEFTGMGFAELKERCCGSAKIKLRHNQFKLSEKNATMGIWLGKVWLGQKDTDDKNNNTVTLQDIVNFVSELKK
jgi:hypothetical protein